MFRLKLWSPFALQKHGRYFQRRSEDMHSVNTLSQWLIKHLTPWWNRNTGPIYRLLYFFLDTPEKKKKTCHRGWTCPHVCTEYMSRLVSLGCGQLLVYIITNKPINADWESYETRGDWTEPLASVIHSECYVDLQGRVYIFRRLTGSRAVLVYLVNRCKELQR